MIIICYYRFIRIIKQVPKSPTDRSQNHLVPNSCLILYLDKMHYRSLAEHGMGAWQQVKIIDAWTTMSSHYMVEILLKMTLNHNQPTNKQSIIIHVQAQNPEILSVGSQTEHLCSLPSIIILIFSPNYQGTGYITLLICSCVYDPTDRISGSCSN